MRIQGAIFDMDGTLTDSMLIWKEAGDNFLRKNQIEPPAGLYEALKNLSMLQTAAYMMENFSIPGPAERLMKEINQSVEEQYRYCVPVKDGVLPLLKRLKKKGISLCVATATDRHLAQAALTRLELLPYFDFILTCTEVGAGKTEPKIFQDAAKRMGTLPEKTAVFEDAVHAVRTAKKAGFPVVAVSDFSAKAEEAEIRRLADQFVYQLKDCEEERL